MSRFANPKAVKRLELGPCDCPGKPDPTDWVEHRTQLGYAALGDIAFIAQTDVMRAKRKTIELLVTAWNLRDDDGGVMPITAAAVDELDPATAEAIYASIDVSVNESQTLPNG